MCGIEKCTGPINNLTDILRKRGIKLLHQNVRGLGVNFEAIEEILYNYKNIDILTLSETHLTKSDMEEVYSIPGYTYINRIRKAGKGGGIRMYITNRVKWIRRHDLEKDDIDILWIEIKLENSNNFLLSTFYQPPGFIVLPSTFNKTFEQILSNVAKESKEAILLGDMNINFSKKGANSSRLVV